MDAQDEIPLTRETIQNWTGSGIRPPEPRELELAAQIPDELSRWNNLPAVDAHVWRGKDGPVDAKRDGVHRLAARTGSREFNSSVTSTARLHLARLAILAPSRKNGLNSVR